MTSRTEPFFDALLLRHPAIGTVILGAASPPASAPSTLAQRDAARALVDEVAAGAAAWLPGAIPTSEWAATDRGLRPLAQLAGSGDPDLLDRLEEALRADAWRVRRTRAAYDRLVGDRCGVEVIATRTAAGLATLTVLGEEIGPEPHGGER